MSVQGKDNGGWGAQNGTADVPEYGGTYVSAKNNPFLSLYNQSSMMGQNNSIQEMEAIRDGIRKQLKAQRETARDSSVKVSIPHMADMSTDQSPNLPGVILSVVADNVAYLMPVMFHKKGSVDTIETIHYGNDQNNSRPFTKIADTFMDKNAIEGVKAAYVTNNSPDLPAGSKGTPITNQIILAHPVISIDEYLVNDKDSEVAINNIIYNVLNMWYKALANFSLRATLSITQDLSNIRPFKDGKLFGNDNSAYITVEPCEKDLTIDGRPVPYNLQVKSITANKNQTYGHINANNNKHIATTFLNVTLECMSAQEMVSTRQRALSNPSYSGTTVGPLIPVISIGETKAGEQLLGNQNMLTWMYGIFQAIAANNPQMFTEAIRGSSVGARGNLVNLAQTAYAAAGFPANNADHLTSKNITDPGAVFKFMHNYISPIPVYVYDIAYNLGDTSESNFLWKLTEEQNNVAADSTKTFSALADIISDGNFTKVVNENRGNSQNSNQNTWILGNQILQPTSTLIPCGMGFGKNGRWFNLEEVDDMLLHDSSAFGDNITPHMEYRTLITGADGKDWKIRQFEIKRMLDGLFTGGLHVTGWKVRHALTPGVVGTIGTAMTRAHNVRVSAPYMANTVWQRSVSSEYLNMGVQTTLSSPMNNNAIMGATNYGYSFQK